MLASTIYVLGLLTGYDNFGQVCLNPTPVLERGQGQSLGVRRLCQLLAFQCVGGG